MFVLILCVICLSVSMSSIASDICPNCCVGYGGISYGDSSSGRFVCNNGYVSQCYSTRHAIMNLQKFKGCCMWEGGVLKVTLKGEVICRDGQISELCTSAYQQASAVVF